MRVQGIHVPSCEWEDKAHRKLAHPRALLDADGRERRRSGGGALRRAELRALLFGDGELRAVRRRHALDHLPLESLRTRRTPEQQVRQGLRHMMTFISDLHFYFAAGAEATRR